MGMIADQMRQTLRDMAQADARMLRAVDQYSKRTQALLAEMQDEAPALPAASKADAIADAIALLEANGYTVNR